MKKSLFLLIFLHSFFIHGQCDVAITDINFTTYEVTIEVINSAGCIAAPIGGTPGKVSQIQIGYHLPEPINPDNEVIEDFNETFGLPPCSPQWDVNGYYLGQNPNSNYPGWWYSPSTSTTFDPEIMGDGLVTGDIAIIPLNPPGDYVTYPSPTAECGDDLIDYWLSEGECIEFVLWQINYGATWHAGNGGWATNTNNPDWIPDTYQDQNCNNSWYTCRDENPGAPVANPDACEDLIPGCTDPTACNYNEEATDEDGSCVYCDEGLCDNVPAYCYGCIDPIALNYDENSQIDDGTCVYSTGPDLVPIEVVVTDQYCLENGTTHVFQYQLTVVNIGTEDVGEFCTTTFLSSNQYNCPTDIDINPGDTAIFLGSFQATWNSGQSNYVELDFVEGLNGEQEIVTGNNNLVFSMPEYEICDYTDIEPGVLNITTQCAGESRYKLNFSAVNLGIDTISNYCYNYGVIGGPEFNFCISSDGTYPNDNIIYEIPPGQDQFFTTGWIPYPNECGGEVFVEFYNVNGENIEDNNTITDWLPSNPCPPVDTLYIEIELPPDTIIETEFIYDTTYIEVQLPPDTIYIEVTDTLYVELPPDTVTVTETEFIFVTDTIYETDIVFITDTLYITLIDTIIEYQFIEIDCTTGLPCEENPGFDDCDPLTVYIPNTFTPNNDGYNDAWEIVIFPECWAEVDAKVYNRWGGVIWQSTDPYNLIWEGGFNNGDYYVPDGTYYWTFTGRKASSAYVEQLEGHVTIFR